MQGVLVTGSAGFLGRAVCRQLEVHGVRVRRFDVRHHGNDHGDIRDREQLRRALEGCDGAIHLAAVSRVQDAAADPERCHQINVEATRRLAEALREGSNEKWLVFASSREVYGDVRGAVADESTPFNPTNVYGASKAAAEYSLDAFAGDGLSVSVLRLTNVYGSTDDHPGRVVLAFARDAVLGRPLRVCGERTTLDFVHRDDVVRGILDAATLLHRRRAPLPTMQLVSGKSTTLADLAHLVRGRAGSSSTIDMRPHRDGTVETFHGTATRARRELGWVCQTPLEQGVQRLIDDVRAATRTQTMKNQEMR